MKCEVKQIQYKPETYDNDGMVKTEAYFAVNLNLPITQEVREALLDIIAGGSPHAFLQLTAEQPPLPLSRVEKGDSEKGEEQ